MTVLYSDLFKAREQFAQFKQLGFPPVMYVRRVHPVVTAVEAKVNLMMSQYDRLIIKHGQETAPGRHEAKGEALWKVAAAFDPLLAEEVDLGIKPLTLDELAQAEGALNGTMMNALWFMIDGVERPYAAPAADEEE